jgi:hypothetical protein
VKGWASEKASGAHHLASAWMATDYVPEVPTVALPVVWCRITRARG